MRQENEYITEIISKLTEEEEKNLILKIYEQVFRKNFSKSGFSHIKFGYQIESREFRILTTNWVKKLNEIYLQNENEPLKFVAMGRYDQKETTKFHLDGGPEESCLILGYEPSEVKSEIFLADYTLAAFERKISPKEFLERHNPMFSQEENLLNPYITKLINFNRNQTNLLFINNSRSDSKDNHATLGVLHKAQIVQSFPDKSRVVNSIQIGKQSDGVSASDDSQLAKFVDSDVISRKPYQ